MEAGFRAAFPGASESDLAAKVYQAMSRSVTDRERAILAQVERQVKITERVIESNDPKTGKPWTGQRLVDRIRALVEGDDTRQHTDVESIQGSWEAHRGILHSGLNKALQEFTRRVWTPGISRHKALQLDVEQALWGRGRNAVARGIAKEFHANNKRYHDFMYSKGVRLFYDANAPQLVVHTAKKLLKVSKADWIKKVLPLLDRSKMVDDTGVPYSLTDLTKLLGDKYDFFTTHGLSQLIPGERANMPFWKRLDDGSFFSWKDYDSWKAYNNEFGYDDFFSAMLAHTDQMARNMGIVSVMGPDPKAMYRFLHDHTEKAVGAMGKAGSRSGTDNLRWAWDIATGESGHPGNAFWAEASVSLRNTTHSAVLGGLTPLAMVTDNITASHARKFNGIARGLGLPKMLNDWMRLMAAGPKAKAIEEATAIGVSLQSVRSGIMGAMRGVGDFDGFKWSHIVADTNFRASGLTAITDAIQSAFVSDFTRSLQAQLGKPFKDFSNPRLAETLEVYGITEKDWLDFSTRAKFINVRGRNVLSFAEMAKAGDMDAAIKLLAMIDKEKDVRAVISGSPRTRRTLRQGTRAGTAGGEALRFGTDLLSWPVTFLWSQIGARAKDRYMSAISKVAQTATLVVALSLAGALIVQFRQVQNRKDLLGWDDPSLWLQALAIGGGFGIMGDLFFKEHYGSSDSAILDFLGPSVATISQLLVVPFKGMQAAVTGETQPNYGRETVSLLRRTLPFSSLWLGKAAIDRYVFDELSMWLDPNAYDLFRDRTRAAAREHGQGYWWPPAQDVQRAPQVATPR